LELGTLFSKSYGKNIQASIKQAAGAHGSVNEGTLPDQAKAIKTFITPFMQPGILYNTIKSGIAVDWPIMTGSYHVTGAWTGDTFPISSSSPLAPWSSSFLYNESRLPNQTSFGGDNLYPRITSSFHIRLPFETLYEPEKYTRSLTIFDSEPHPAAALDSQATWNGKGDPIYKMAIHNFLAETVNFFLEEQKLTSFSSAPGEFLATQGKEYMMDVKLARPFVERTVLINSGATEAQQFFVDSGSFEMYSRPSAFGPPMDAQTRTLTLL
jgi:hypothetical protein